MATQPLEQQVLHIFELIETTGFARKCNVRLDYTLNRNILNKLYEFEKLLCMLGDRLKYIRLIFN